jgi:nucleotide-binding universal stress UspA family protein
MFKRILVPLDGSTRAEHVLPIARRLARVSGGSLIFLQVVDPEWIMQTAVTQDIIDYQYAAAESYLHTIAASEGCKELPSECLVLTGSAAKMILETATSHGADLIALCSQGYTGIKRWMMGSVADKVIRNASIPVFVCREESHIPTTPQLDETRPLRILIPLDGSSHARAVLEPTAALIAAIASPSAAELHLLQVVPPLPHNAEKQQTTSREASLQQKAKRYLKQTAEHLHEGLAVPVIASLRIPITWSVAINKDIASEIVNIAETGENATKPFDIIAISTHGLGGFARWTMGSITDRVIRSTKLPLLVVRPPAMIHHEQKFAETKSNMITTQQ